MRAMILAAGLGTRLLPLTNYLPKPLFPVVGVPNIVRVIHHLKGAGIRDIVINLHHLPEMIRATIGTGEQLGVSVSYTQENTLLGTAGGIRNALRYLGDETFLVVNGDAFFAPDIVRALEFHQKSGAGATLVLRSDPRAESYGAVGLDDSGKVVRLAWVKSEKQEVSLGMFTGVHILEPSFVGALPASGCIVRETYMPLIQEGAPIYGYFNNNWFFDLGTPRDYLRANLSLLLGEISLDGFAPPAEKVFVGSDVELGTGSRLLEGAIVGHRARIAPGVSIERAVILDDSHVHNDIRDAVVVSNQIVTAK